MRNPSRTSRQNHQRPDAFKATAALAAAMALACGLLACGGGGGSTPVAAPAPVPLTTAFNDALVKGVCYLAQPSGLHGATDASGNASYLAGDSLTWWVMVDGSACSATPATTSSTTGIALGSTIPVASTTGVANQTFVLSLASGSQVAEALQALNHGTTSAMDVSGITLPNTGGVVANINGYIASTGASQATPALVGTLFQSAQNGARVGGAALVPALPITNVASFQGDVISALANTATTGFGTAPTTVTIPPNRINFSVNSGSYIRTQANGTVLPAVQFADAHFIYFDGSNPSAGAGEIVRPMQLSGTPNISNYNGTNGVLETAEVLDHTYSVTANVVTKTFTMKTYLNAANGTATDVTTVQFDDGHTSVHTGTNTKAYSGGAVDNVTYVGTSTHLTPVTTAMLANKTVTTSGGGCNGKGSKSVFNSTGTGSTTTDLDPTCNNGVAQVVTYAPSVKVPGVLILTYPVTPNTSNDGKILYVGLDGPGIQPGSSIVYIVENDGSGVSGGTVHQQYGRGAIVSVQ